MMIKYLIGFGLDLVEWVFVLLVFVDQDFFLFGLVFEVEVIKGIGWFYLVYGYLDYEVLFKMIVDQV